MYNLTEYRLNYSETTGNLWFYSKDEATNFNADIANNDNFKSFKYKAKLLGNTAADGPNGILRNATIAVPLKYLSNFWRSLEMPLINFTIKDTKLYVPVATLSVRDNQKLSKLLSKGSERSIY